MLERDQFIGKNLPSPEVFRQTLQGLPAIDERRLFCFAMPKTREWVPEQVSLKHLMVTIAAPNWDIEGCEVGNSGSVYKIATKLVTGQFNFDERRLNLFNYGGLYGLSMDGRHRAAAFKGINNDATISALVNRYQRPEYLFLTTSELTFLPQFLTLELRRRQGLWQGKWSKIIKTNWNSDYSLCGQVSDY